MGQPLGLAKQWTVDEMGNWVLTYRLMQDLSYTNCKLDSGWKLLINSSGLVMEDYPEMTYGWCLPCILHFVVFLCCFYPGWAILFAKHDYSDAYHRIAHSASAIAQTISMVRLLTFAYL
jgi:hypothetical protein